MVVFESGDTVERGRLTATFINRHTGPAPGIMAVPGGARTIKTEKVAQSTITKFANGHIKCLSFAEGQKAYLMCTN
ncbi:hypothetical protein TNCV_648751 [Trichonephila clavipes]|uniref:Uncharacterized protein n=1 Tax=Trichonephila clavipes TaxID=2585209 RepID=A0A8X6ST57_TRICX|nr:hypothetical protein TNCV_648751 [Trichonephila clavipes]